VNDQKITQVKLKEGDKIVIGQTVYKFSRIESKGKIDKPAPKDFVDDPLPVPEGAKKNERSLVAHHRRGRRRDTSF